MKENKKIPPATVKRLPVYLQCLDQIDPDDIGISSKKLAELAKVNDAQVRRDLSHLGTLGTRGVGYDIIEHCPPQNIGSVSATKIRKKLLK